MGIFLRLIGVALIGVGILSIITRIPNQLSTIADDINPLVRLGITNPSIFVQGANKEQTLLYDLLLIFVIIIIGLILAMKGGGKKDKLNPLKK